MTVRILQVEQLPQLAVAEGAATTEPAGAIAWSTTVGKVMESTGSVWRSVSSTAASATGPSRGQVVAIALGNITP